MKNWIALPIVLLFLSSTCNKVSKSTTCFKGKLEIKGMCMNYTIRLLEGDTSVIKIVSNWTDETTGKTYKNVFGLENPCSFKDLEEGDEFYFEIDKAPKKDCVVCQAYYPTPAQKNNILVLDACP
jgi:hypothetical protein